MKYLSTIIGSDFMKTTKSLDIDFIDDKELVLNS